MPWYGQSLEAKSQVWKVAGIAVPNRPRAQRYSRIVRSNHRYCPQIQEVPDPADVVGVMVGKHNRG
jgi:hypothetical protein